MVIAGDFLSTQRILAEHLRDPAHNPGPADVEDRRIGIYRELIYNNLESFISAGFPVLRSLFAEQDWQVLVRAFIRHHRCASPYFAEISQEFVHFLQAGHPLSVEVPAFMLELAHYEWVELALEVSTATFPSAGVDPDGDLLGGVPLVSPLAWALSYQFPVHRVGPDFRPATPPATPTFLVVYRDRADQVRFIETNPITARLLRLLGDRRLSGRAALMTVAGELNHPAPDQLVAAGLETLEQFRRLDVLTGVLA